MIFPFLGMSFLLVLKKQALSHLWRRHLAAAFHLPFIVGHHIWADRPGIPLHLQCIGEVMPLMLRQCLAQIHTNRFNMSQILAQSHSRSDPNGFL